MRTGLIIFGIIFLVIGGLLYFIPMQNFSAQTTSGSDSRTSSASVTVPVEWAYASGIIGFLLLVLGFAIPSPSRRGNPKKDSYDRVVESKENIEIGDGNKRKIVRERSETHRGRNDNN